MSFMLDVDLRSTLPTIRDQGDRGTCTAFAVTANHEFCRSHSLRLSEEDLFWQCFTVDPSCLANGTCFPGALMVLLNSGQVEYSVWPYSDVNPTADQYVPPATVATAERHQITGCRPIEPTIANIQEQLVAENFVMVGMKVFKHWLRAGTMVIGLPPHPQEEIGNHAMLAVGFKGDPGDKDGYLIVRNSWGKNWGEGGYGYVSYECVERYLLEAYVMEYEDFDALDDNDSTGP
jgi:C1A family cysteine protease